MSALGSSVINKSAKKFAPKAPSRRPPPAPSSAQTSTRPSAERQIQSQTPQPQPLSHAIAASPTPSIPISTPAPTPVPEPQRKDGRIRIVVPTHNEKTLRANSLQPVIPQKRAADARHTEERVSSRPQSQAGSSVPPSIPFNAATTVTPSIAPTHSLTPPLEQTTTDTPAGKRRKLTKPQERTAITSQTSPQGDPNVAIPSTESHEPAAGGNVQDGTSSLAQTAKNKAPRKSTAKKRKLQVEDVGTGTAEKANLASKKLRMPRRKRRATSDGHAEAGDAENAIPRPEEGEPSQASTLAKRKPRKPRGKQAMEDAATAIVEDAVYGASKASKKMGRRSKRAATPEEAEHAQIEAAETRMSELCRDDGKGRKSFAEGKLREMDRAAFVKKKQEELQVIMGQGNTTPEAGEPEETRLDRLEARRQREEAIAMNVPNTIIVNGEIQIDQSSLRIDRHAIAARERDAEQLDYVDENDLSRKTNYGSWVKRDKSGGWNNDLVDRFYDGLRMFGTDFGMISKMFPGKTRHAIKLKFCREEREDAARIRATLLGENMPVVLEDFQRMTGEEYEDPAILEQDMEDDKKKLEEEQEAEKEAIEAARRERAEQAEAERVAAQGEENSVKENRRKNRRKRASKGEKRQEKEKEAPRTKARRGGQGGMLEGVGEISQARAPEVPDKKSSSARLKPIDVR